MNTTGTLGRVLLLCALLMATATVHADDDDDKTVYGWVEKAQLIPWGVTLKAKLDTGALTSSLHATDIEKFDKDDEDWVRFTTPVEDERTDDRVEKQFERRLYRTLTVSGAGGKDERLVVLLDVCMNDTIYEEQFSLRDRGDMIYPLLLGRRSIKHLGLIDVSQTFLNDPECDHDSKYVANQESSHEDDD
jgi:Uncharacterized protein conserved in archaea